MIPRLRALTAAALAATTIFAAAGSPQLAAAAPSTTCPTTAYMGDVEVLPLTTCILTVAVKGNITVDDDATLELEGASVAGNIIVHAGGALFSDYSSASYVPYPCGPCSSNGPFGTYQDTGKHSSVSGSILFNDNTPCCQGSAPVLILINTSVGKSVTVNGIPSPDESPTSDPFQLAICGASISGGLTLSKVQASLGAFIGDPSDLNNENEFPQFDGHCAGNRISGDLTATDPNLMAIEGNRGSGSYISGGLHVTNGFADIDGNTISGGATCTNTRVLGEGWDSDILVPNTIGGAKTGTGC